MFFLKNKVFLGLFSVICIAIVAFFTYRYSYQTNQSGVVQKIAAHHATRPEISLSEVVVDAYYFVPKDQTERIDAAWKQNLEGGLTATKQFFEQQSKGGIGITYRIYPEPVIGEQTSDVYNGETQAGGNVHALETIHKELRARTMSGQLSFGNVNEAGTYHVQTILYEDVGAASMVLLGEHDKAPESGHIIALHTNDTPAMIVSDYFFTGPSYIDYGTTIFAHEFGHLLGLFDEYGEDDHKSKTDDLMGSGRLMPLGYTYLSKSQLIKLGIK